MARAKPSWLLRASPCGRAQVVASPTSLPKPCTKSSESRRFASLWPSHGQFQLQRSRVRPNHSVKRTPNGVARSLNSNVRRCNRCPQKLRQTFLVCDRSSAATAHTVLGSAESDVEYSDADGYRGADPATYTMFRCDGCTRVSLYILSSLHSPHSEFGECKYPQLPSFSGLPAEVAQCYWQAQKLRPVSDSAYATAARRVLEAVVSDRRATGRNLDQGLRRLIEQEFFPPFLAEAINFIRIFGNEAAYETPRAGTALDAEMIERFLAATLDHVYWAPAALEQFKHVAGIAWIDRFTGAFIPCCATLPRCR
jgi:Domain of unknown function (DUF4145)